MSQIKASIIAYSKSSVNNKEIVTFELEYPRFIHGELMTHRLFSRNAASSRAIPVTKMIEQVQNNAALPIHWGKNQPGMQANTELEGEAKDRAMEAWMLASASARMWAEDLVENGAHKQIVNRILEPFQIMKTVLTATELDNFFWLRKHEDAQPEIRVLAEKMWEALQEREPVVLEPGDWHVPYFSGSWGQGVWKKDAEVGTLEDALAISSSCSAQVSYRLLDNSLDKARIIFGKLVESKPVHASPFEHQATPMECVTFEPQYTDCDEGFVEGVTHMDKNLNYWSGNLKGWVQHRQLIPDNVCWDFKE